MVRKSQLIPSVVLLATIAGTPGALAQGAKQAPMAALCASCHQPQPGVMMGFLENISLKSRIIQMDFMSHKDVVQFDGHTAVKYVKSFEDINNYLGKGFQVNYREENGDKIATEVIRFDILKTVTSDERLDKEAFKKLRANPATRVYDVRPPMAYQMAHIPGAGMMPAPAFDKFVAKLPADKSTPIVFYGVGGCLSPTASMKTKSLGYSDVKIYIGGYPDWVKSETGVTEGEWLKMAISKGVPHVLLDLREAAEVAAGHIPGAVNITAAQLGASRAMFPADKMAPIVVYGPGSEAAAATIHGWGYKKVQVLAMDFGGWQGGGNPVATGPTAGRIVYVPKAKPGTISVVDFEKAAHDHPAGTVIVDVRNPDEYAAGSIKGAINIPADLIGRKAAEVPADKELVLFCNTGARAEMAHNVLDNQGRKNRFLDAVVTVEKDGAVEIEEK